MAPSPTRPLTASLLAGLALQALAACGGDLRSGMFHSFADAAASAGNDSSDAATITRSPSEDAAVSSPGIDGATPPLLPAGDASAAGAASLDGAIDPGAPCPTAVASLRCSVEGAHLCGSVCSLQCTCIGGLWSCHLPPC